MESCLKFCSIFSNIFHSSTHTEIEVLTKMFWRPRKWRDYSVRAPFFVFERVIIATRRFICVTHKCLMTMSPANNAYLRILADHNPRRAPGTPAWSAAPPPAPPARNSSNWWRSACGCDARSSESIRERARASISTLTFCSRARAIEGCPGD